jgi:hypothetical protein
MYNKQKEGIVMIKNYISVKMLKAYKAGTLPFKPKCSYELLYEQLIHMRAKLKVLEKRAEIEGIELIMDLKRG